MWLSNGDLERLLIAALTADSSNWEGGSVIVNGVSANRGSAWDVAGGRASIGYDPQDDVQERLRVAPLTARVASRSASGAARRRTQPSARVESRTTIS